MGRLKRIGGLLITLALAASAASAGAASALGAPASPGVAGPSASAAGKPTVAVLSNYTTLSRWAYPQSAAAAHRSPSATSRVVGRLKFLTPDGQTNVYLVLRSWYSPASGATWYQVPLPGRPNGVVGWVPAAALGAMHVVREYLLVNREREQVTLFRNGHAIFRAPVGVGRPSLPTPAGHFYVLEKLTAIGTAFYGPYAFGTSAYAPSLSEWPGGGVVGIHGTNEPSLIPGDPSHGCMRLKNPDITRLWHLMSVGTPIDIV